MRITHVITGLVEPGGAEQTLYKLPAGSLSERWATQVVSPTGDGAFGAALRARGVSVVSLGMRPSRLGVSAVVALRRALRRFNSRIVQGWMYQGNLAASIGVAGLRPPPALLWNIRNGLLGRPARSKVFARFSLPQMINDYARFYSHAPCTELACPGDSTTGR